MDAKVIISILFLVLLSPQALGQGSAGAANNQMLTGIVGAGMSAAYSAQQFSKCNSKNWRPCVIGALAAAQAILGIQNAMATKDVRDAYSGGDFSFDPGEAGFCLSGNNCKQDALDKQLQDFETAFKTDQGYEAALAKLKAESLDRLKALEEKGFKVDLENGVVTDPSGKTHNAQTAGVNIPNSLQNSAAEKLAGLKEALDSKGARRGLASVGGASGRKGSSGSSLKIIEESVGGSGLDPFRNKRKDKFLSGLSDKKKEGSDAIGVAGDDIFKMIQRRYTKKKKNKEFIFR